MREKMEIKKIIVLFSGLIIGLVLILRNSDNVELVGVTCFLMMVSVLLFQGGLPKDTNLISYLMN